MLPYYMTPLTREKLIAESKRLVAERAQWRREGDKAGQGEHREFRAADEVRGSRAAA